MELDRLGNAFTVLAFDSFPEIKVGSKTALRFDASRVEGEQWVRFERMTDKRIQRLDYVLEHYSIQHEIARDKTYRRPDSEKIERGYFDVRRFPVFFARGNGVMFCQVAKDVAWGFLGRVNGEELNEEPIAGIRQSFDLQKLRAVAEDPTGAWFRYPDGDRRRALALFARGMERTEEFKKAEADGHLTVLHLNYTWRDEPIHVAVSERGTIQVLETGLDENEQLAVSTHLWENYLQPQEEEY